MRWMHRASIAPATRPPSRLRMRRRTPRGEQDVHPRETPEDGPKCSSGSTPVARWALRGLEAMAPAAEVRIGVSGWLYAPWRGTFYPSKLPHAKELAFASRAMRSIEINGSFYPLQRPSSYARWHEQTPEDFVFAVKGGRFLTHNKKLRDCGGPLAISSPRGCSRSRRSSTDPVAATAAARLRCQAPGGVSGHLAAHDPAGLAAPPKHDGRLRHPPLLTTREDRPIRYAIEVRHETYRDAVFIKVLRDARRRVLRRRHGGTLAVLRGRHVGLRLRAAARRPRALRERLLRARRFTSTPTRSVPAWRDGKPPLDPKLVGAPAPRRPRDVFVYFDNDVKVRAPFDAMNLARAWGSARGSQFPARRTEPVRRRVAWRSLGPIGRSALALTFPVLLSDLAHCALHPTGDGPP